MQTWTISGVKEKARTALKANHLKIALVTLLVMIITGAGGGVSSLGNTMDDTDTSTSGYEQSYNEESPVVRNYEEGFDDILDGDMGSEAATAVGVFSLIFIVIMLVVVVFSIAYTYFLANPFMVGARRFFNRSMVEDANIRELVSPFTNGNYLRTVKIMFLMNLYVGLWTLLFIIPGFIKSYEYRMIPYIIMENPELSTKEVFARSKELMYGNKWSTFLLDWSFFGWILLTIFTCGIAGFVWVFPYQYMTDAALYRELSGADRYEYQNMNYQQAPNGNPYSTTGYTGQQNMNNQYNQNGYYNQQNMNNQYNNANQYNQNSYYNQQDANNPYNNVNQYNQNGYYNQQDMNNQYTQSDNGGQNVAENTNDASQTGQDDNF